MKVGMVGLGNMGTAIANNIVRNGHALIGWEYCRETVSEINTKHVNTRYLPGVDLDHNLVATNNIKEAVQDKKIIFVALPSTFIKKVLCAVAQDVSQGAIIVSLSKGLDEETSHPVSYMLKDIFPQHEVIVLSGPSIANEFAHGLPCGVVLGGANVDSLYIVARVIETSRFRTRFSSDIIGVELAGIMKNIYAIGLGLIDGAGIESINFKSAFLTRAIQEMADLICALGGKSETVYYLAGLGDLIATSLSQHSHNRKFGELLSKGLSAEAAQKKMGVLPEGLKALRIALYLGEKYHIPMPVAKGLSNVVAGELKAATLVDNFKRIGV